MIPPIMVAKKTIFLRFMINIPLLLMFYIFSYYNTKKVNITNKSMVGGMLLNKKNMMSCSHVFLFNEFDLIFDKK